MIPRKESPFSLFPFREKTLFHSLPSYVFLPQQRGKYIFIILAICPCWGSVASIMSGSVFSDDNPTTTEKEGDASSDSGLVDPTFEGDRWKFDDLTLEEHNRWTFLDGDSWFETRDRETDQFDFGVVDKSSEKGQPLKESAVVTILRNRDSPSRKMHIPKRNKEIPKPVSAPLGDKESLSSETHESAQDSSTADEVTDIHCGGTNKEKPGASRKEDKTKEASSGGKESSNWEDTTVHPSISLSSNRDSKPEETLERTAWDRTKRTAEVSAQMVPLTLLSGTENPTQIQKETFQFATDSGIERPPSPSLPRHKFGSEEETESSNCAGSQNSLGHYVASFNLETAPVVTGFDVFPDVVLLLIFKQLRIRDKLRLEGVSRRWQRLLIESWKDVRVLKMSEIFLPSLTFDDFGFLRSRARFLKSLDFGDVNFRDGEHDFLGTNVTFAKQMIWAFTSPPCTLEEVRLWNAILDQTTLSWLNRIGHQIRSLAFYDEDIDVDSFFEDMIDEDPEDGRPFFNCFPNLVRLECPLSVICKRKYIHVLYNNSWKFCDSLSNASVKCLYLKQINGEAMKHFCDLEEPMWSLRELHLKDFCFADEDETTILRRLSIRFPNLEVFGIEGFDALSNLELIGPLKKLRELYLEADIPNFEFSSHASSFAFRETLEKLHIRIRNEEDKEENDFNYGDSEESLGQDPEESLGQDPEESLGPLHIATIRNDEEEEEEEEEEDAEESFGQLENLRHFPNLKDLLLRGKGLALKKKEVEKIKEVCKNLQRIQVESP